MQHSDGQCEHTLRLPDSFLACCALSDLRFSFVTMSLAQVKTTVRVSPITSLALVLAPSLSIYLSRCASLCVSASLCLRLSVSLSFRLSVSLCLCVSVAICNGHEQLWLWTLRCRFFRTWANMFLSSLLVCRNFCKSRDEGTWVKARTAAEIVSISR